MSSRNNVLDASSSNENTCVVCFRNVDTFSVGDCDHPVCYECSTKMRVLHQQQQCPTCRHDMQKVIFTKSVKPFKQLRRSLGPRTTIDRKFQIVFESPSVQAAYDALLAHVCPICPNHHAFQTFNHLQDHVRKEHELFYCDLCVENLKILTQERKCYSRRDLGIHREQGDPDDRSHRGHPLCEFCDSRYYDDDELCRHLRRDHLFCCFCDTDGLHQYYDSYDVLRNHFREQHYLCEEGECYEKSISAFRTEIDLKAHRVSVHGRHMTKAAAKQARTLELAFTLKPRPGQTDHRRGWGWPSRYQSHSDEEEGAVGGMAVDYRTSQQTTSAPSFSKINTASNDEFPPLGETAAPPSLQGVHFRKPGVTIRAEASGGLAITDEDFPGPDATTSASDSLRVNTNGSVAERAKTKPNVSIHINRRPYSVVTAVSRPREQFPALSTKASTQNSSQWTAREMREEPKFIVKTKPTLVSSQPQQKPQKSLEDFNFDEDNFLQNNFPALGGNLPSNFANLVATQWSSGREPEAKVSVNKNKSNQPPPKPPQPKAFLSEDEDDFPSLNSRFDASCSFAQEKKKESLISNPVENDWTKVVKGDSASSDNNIGSEKGNTKKKMSNNEPNKKDKQKEEPKGKEKQIKVEEWGKTQIKEETVEKKKQEGERKRSELRIESENGHSQLENQINLNDFPSLNSNRVPPGFSDGDKPTAPRGFESSTRPPPGFPNSNPFIQDKPTAPRGFESSTRPPPGFPNSNPFIQDKPTAPRGFESSTRPPPGFPNSNPFIQDKPTAPRGFESSTRPPPGFPNSNPFIQVGETARAYAYVSPVDMKQRNTDLVQRVREAFGSEEALNGFIHMCAFFRQGLLNAETYYVLCKMAMGETAFTAIFPELLVLLPDIDKQQELWKVAEKRKQWMLQVCAVCGQVVTSADLNYHLVLHSLENYFLAMANEVTSSSNAWKK